MYFCFDPDIETYIILKGRSYSVNKITPLSSRLYKLEESMDRYVKLLLILFCLISYYLIYNREIDVYVADTGQLEIAS